MWSLSLRAQSDPADSFQSHVSVIKAPLFLLHPAR